VVLGAVHVALLVGLRNRFSVMLDWFWAYLTFRSGTRLITGGASTVEKANALEANMERGALPQVRPRLSSTQ
jgi:hypothetical protein